MLYVMYITCVEGVPRVPFQLHRTTGSTFSWTFCIIGSKNHAKVVVVDPVGGWINYRRFVGRHARTVLQKEQLLILSGCNSATTAETGWRDLARGRIRLPLVEKVVRRRVGKGYCLKTAMEFITFPGITPRS